MNSVPKDPIDVEAALKRRGWSLASLGRVYGINRTVMSHCVNHSGKVWAAIEAALEDSSEAA
jgi:lambda repressor-like predicted transcriptional regulator